MLPASLAQQTRSTLIAYLRTTFGFCNHELEEALFSFLTHPENGLFRGPFIDLRLPFRQVTDPQIPLDIRPNFLPWAHQLRAFDRLSSAPDRKAESTLITTGTGSGKTECFLYPVLDHCFRHVGEKGIKAILLYPMNALATDQAGRFAKEIFADPRLRDTVTAGLYVGGDGEHHTMSAKHLVDKREVLRNTPPDILLTNYRMLDLLLMRPSDKGLWRHNSPESLQYLVLDELHTYDGAQGSDVACLIRRLKDRLSTPKAYLICVGTSATIGNAGSRDPIQLLAEFASQVFGEEIGTDAIIGEDRLTVSEAFPAEATTDKDPIAVATENPNILDPHNYESAETFLAAQIPLWLEEVPESPVALGHALEKHAFLRDLLRSIDGRDNTGGPRDWLSVAEFLGKRDESFAALPSDSQWFVIGSFLSLVAQARRDIAGKIGPFLPLQMQLWVRELRYLLRRVEKVGYSFGWRDELRASETEHWLPIVYCHECGIDGLGALAVEGRQNLADSSQRIGEAYLRRSQYARFLQLHTQTDKLLPHSICPTCLTFSLGLDPCKCADPPVDRIPAAMPDLLNDKHRFTSACPACGGEDGLSILGSRAASLSSVAISHLFLSPYGGDSNSVDDAGRKMLAFTDSVQDASHRAGFFAGRTFRFNLRTGMQTCVETADSDIPLSDLGSQMIRLWEERLGEAKMIATFLPPDLRELGEYVAYKEAIKPGKGVHDRMIDALGQRLSWEVTREYGMGVIVGRSLDRTGCSTLAIDETRLEEAAEKLLLNLQEERTVEALGGDFELHVIRHFIEGILQRLRLRGGILHPLLDRYMKKGDLFDLSKRRNPLMSPFGFHSVLPKFLYEGDQHKTFEALYSNPSQDSWLRNWTIRSLSLPKMQQAGIHGVLSATMNYLERAGLISWLPCGHSRAAGLNPTHLRVTRDIAQVHCDKCNASHTLQREAAVRWDGLKCTHFRCRGLFQRREFIHDAQNYYRNLHRSRKVRRIFAAEHTGLLDRHSREELEIRFKTGDTPDAPNLLTCTPTLEMGIDIGDLSSVMLCSVPPLPANYLQRVGRAGRATGNALVVTMALARPHDQYFLTAPLEMMRGEINPPGCFLDAPEILLRQMTAHAIDQWAMKQVRGDVLPGAMRFLSSKTNRDGFPQSFYKFYEEGRTRITEKFFAAFGAQLTVPNRERLELLARENKIPTRIEAAFEAVKQESNRLGDRIKVLNKRKIAVDADPNCAVLDPNRPDQTYADAAEEESAQLHDAIRGYGRLLGQQLNKHPLNVLTDEGVLPNYAFPEPGVSLKAVLRSPKPTKGKAKAKATEGEEATTGPKKTAYNRLKFEYIRPASSALKEFAPFNTFYAEGHKMRITQIDVGTAAQRLIETWRFCPRCHYSIQLLGDEAPADNCPRCGEIGWKDKGQRQQVIHFRCAWSSMELADAVTVDDTEERDGKRYKIGELIDAASAEHVGARLINHEDLLFGYELLRGLELKQLNFGQIADTGLPVPIAGEEIVQQGFRVCADCGRVQDPLKRTAPIEHTPYCKARLGKAVDKLENVFLYRSMKSEAIRVLLPVSKHDLLRKRSSISAALQLGFRKMFGGQPTHLRITTASEPHGDEQLQFLVIYDTVPGGTGYLAELWKAGRFLDLLQLSVDAMRTCSCATDPLRDGCYRCLFAYQDAYQLPNISRQEAVELFEKILLHRDKEVEQASLSNTSVLSVLESELEARFLDAMKKKAGEKSWSWDQIVYHGKSAWRMSAGRERWLIEPQVTLGKLDGVGVMTRPDFVIHCESREGVRPIAVFCDGFRYHAQPDEPISRIADDVWKRQSILDSGKYLVWSLTWKDVDRVLMEDQPEAPILWVTTNRLLIDKLLGPARAKDLESGKLGSVELLLEYLACPEDETWRSRVHTLLIGLLRASGMDDQNSADLERRLGKEALSFEFEGGTGVARQWLSGVGSPLPWARLLCRVPVQSLAQRAFKGYRIMLRLFDEKAARVHPDFEESWRAFLQAWNLLQFHHEQVAVVTSERLHLEGESHPATLPSERPPKMPEEDRDDPAAAISKEVPEAKPLMDELVSQGLPLPQLDYRLAKGKVAVDVEAVLAWPDLKIVVHYDVTDADKKRWQNYGFSLFGLDKNSPQEIASAIKLTKEA